MGFNPRSPRGGATIKFVKSSIVLILFQSTLPTRGSDFNFRSFFKPDYGFNPRSPRGGATLYFFVVVLPMRMFQSTLPTRGSDPLSARWIVKGAQVSIHAPHEGERPCRDCVYARPIKVSIHAPHEGERHEPFGYQKWKTEVSIHAPHEGERPDLYEAIKAADDVSIHAPHEGERRRKSAFVCSISANLLNIIHCGTVTRAVSRRRIALFRLFSVRRSGVFMYAYASH